MFILGPCRDEAMAAFDRVVWVDIKPLVDASSALLAGCFKSWALVANAQVDLAKEWRAGCQASAPAPLAPDLLPRQRAKTKLSENHRQGPVALKPGIARN